MSDRRRQPDRDEHVAGDAELYRLAELYVGGDLTADEAAALERRLASDPAALRFFLAYIDVEAELAWPRRVGAVDSQTPASDAWAQIEAPATYRMSTRAFAGALAAAVLIAAGVLIWALAHGDAADERGDGPPVALLLEASDVSWSSEPRTTGETLTRGRLAIDAGTLGVQFESGATMTVRGPAAVLLESPLACRMEHGQVAVHAPESAAGFTVATPTFSVVDLGTGFGVAHEAGAGGGEVHVFDGLVEVRLGDGTVRRVAAGQAVSINAHGVAADRALDAFGFPLVADAASVRWAEMLGRLKFVPALRMHVVADDSGADGADGSAAVTGGGATLHGGSLTAGRFSGARAVALAGGEDRIAFADDRTMDALTLSMWVKFESLNQDIVSLMQTDGYQAGEPHWNVDRTGRVTLGVGNVGVVVADHAVSADDLGRWMHLAASYDRTSGRMRLYRDGRLIAESVVAKATGVRLGAARVGNWDSAGRALKGAVADFMLFDTELSDEAVARLFDAGRGPR